MKKRLDRNKIAALTGTAIQDDDALWQILSYIFQQIGFPSA